MSELYDIDSLLSEVVTLPSLPDTVARITQLVNRPDCPLDLIGKTISADPSLALKTLRLVNSAYYGLRNKITSVEHAVVMLGLRVVKNLVFTAALFDRLKAGAHEYLLHCVSTGVAIRVLAEANPGNLPEEAVDEVFVFGLLHDIGKLVLQEYMAEQYLEVVSMVEEREIPFYEAERAVIGVDHAEVGARVAENWKMSPALVSAIAGHHDLAQCRDTQFQSLAAMLGIADGIAKAAGACSNPADTLDIDDGFWAAGGIENEQLPDLVYGFFDAAPQVEELVNLAS